MHACIIPTKGRHADRNLGATGIVSTIDDQDVRTDGIDRTGAYADRVSEFKAWNRPDYVPRHQRGQALKAAIHSHSRAPIPRCRALVVLVDQEQPA